MESEYQPKSIEKWYKRVVRLDRNYRESKREKEEKRKIKEEERRIDNK